MVRYLFAQAAPNWCSWRRAGHRFHQPGNPAFLAASEDLFPKAEHKSQSFLISRFFQVEMNEMFSRYETEWESPGREWPLFLWRGSAGNRPAHCRCTRRARLRRSRWMVTGPPPFRRGGRRKTTSRHTGYTSNLWWSELSNAIKISIKSASNQRSNHFHFKPRVGSYESRLVHLLFKWFELVPVN